MKGCGQKIRAKIDTKTSCLVRHPHHYNVIQRFKNTSAAHTYIILLSFPAVDETRVILQGRDPNVVGSDYINGNYVKVISQSTYRRVLHRFFTTNANDFVLHLCRIRCVRAVLQKYTLRAKDVSQLLSMISGKWCGKRRQESSS